MFNHSLGLRGPEQSERPYEPRASGQPSMGSTPCAPDAIQLALACIRAKVGAWSIWEHLGASGQRTANTSLELTCGLTLLFLLNLK